MSNSFFNKICIDIGSEYTKIYNEKKNEFKSESSIIRLDEDGKIIAYGNKSKDMINDEKLNTSKIIKNGSINDFDLTVMFLDKIINGDKKFNFIKPDIFASIHYGISDIEKKAIEDALYMAGARSVTLIYNQLAGAMGCGIDNNKSATNFILSVGSGLVECSVIYKGNIIINDSFKTKEIEIDKKIFNIVKNNFDLIIDVNEINKIKSNLFFSNENNIEILSVNGKDVFSQNHKSINISSVEFIEINNYFSNRILRLASKILKLSPPKILNDIVNSGITLIGGYSKIKGLNYKIEDEFNIKTNMIKKPERCTIIGLSRMIK